MSVCEKLVIADAFVVSNILKPQERRPMMMYKIDDFSDFLNEVSSNSTLAKTLEGFSKLYREADNRGYRILPDKFGGFGLFNVTGKLLKPKFEPLEDIVGIIEEIPDSLKEKLSPLSIMKSSFTEKEVVLLGVTRFVNHSCYPNTRYFQGYSCNYLPYKALRLQVIRSIKPGEEITVDYGDSFLAALESANVIIVLKNTLLELNQMRAIRRANFLLLVKIVQSLKARVQTILQKARMFQAQQKSSQKLAPLFCLVI